MAEKRKKTIRILLAAAVLVLLIALAAYFLWERPPEIAETPAEPEPEAEPAEIIVEAVPTPTPEPMPEGEAFETGRQNGVYTILLVGLDQMSTSTDAILVGKIDTRRHEMNFVSIFSAVSSFLYSEYSFCAFCGGVSRTSSFIVISPPFR